MDPPLFCTKIYVMISSGSQKEFGETVQGLAGTRYLSPHLQVVLFSKRAERDTRDHLPLLVSMQSPALCWPRGWAHSPGHSAGTGQRPAHTELAGRVDLRGSWHGQAQHSCCPRTSVFLESSAKALSTVIN